MNAHNPPELRSPPEIPPIVSLEAFERTCAKDFPSFVSKFKALTLDHLDDPGPEYESLIEGWLSIGDKSAIAGPSQSGKSFFAIHAGMCIATKRDFFGARTEHGLVIYIAGEGARGVKKRLRAWRRHFGVEFTRDTPFVLLQSPIDLYRGDADGGSTKLLIEEIKAICALFPGVPLRLVVVDTLATASIGAEENSARDMGIVMMNVAKVNMATGAHVTLVHHMNAGGDKIRGSTAIYANIDQAIYVTRNEQTKVRTAKMGKHKDEEASISCQFELMSVELGTDKHAKPITSCVCLPVGEKDAIRKGEEAKGWVLSEKEITFMRALFDADKRHGRPVPGDAQGIPDKVRSVVAYDDVKRAFAALNPSDVMPDDDDADEKADPAVLARRRREALKKDIQRLREKLTGRGVIGAMVRTTKDEDGASKQEGIMWFTGRPLRAFPWTLPRDEREPGAGLPMAEEMSSVDF